MAHEKARDIWNRFAKEHEVGRDRINLFKCRPDQEMLVDTIDDFGRPKRRVLALSEKMAGLVRDEAARAIKAFDNGNGDPQTGLLYMMYRTGREHEVIPLYIGKAKVASDKNNRELSGNFLEFQPKRNTGPKAPGSKFARWGYGDAYHMGGLSNAFFNRKEPKEEYVDWAKRLFQETTIEVGENSYPQCKWPVYFWTKNWTSASQSCWRGLDSTPLQLEEELLIRIASLCFPGDLLNRLGAIKQ